jgi:hypothetical protein
MLVRVLDLEVGAEHAEVESEHLRRVRADVDPAGVLVDRVHRDRRQKARDHVIGAVVRDHIGVVMPHCRASALQHVQRRVAVRELPRGESRARGVRRKADAVGAEGAPRLVAGVPGDEVPAAAGADQAVRLDIAAALRAVVALVVEPDPALIPARRRERGQRAGVGPWPGRGHRHRERLQRVHPAAQRRREELLQLGQGADGRFLDPGDRAVRRRAQPDRHRDSLLVVEEQRRHDRPGAEPVPAAHTRRGVDRVAELAQPLDVVADGARRHPEAGCQLRARPVTAALHERQQAQQPGRGFQHVVKFPADCGTNRS